MNNKERASRTEPIASTESDIQLAMRVSNISIIVNLILSVLKFTAGILARSDAMISDAIHSASDVLSTFIVIIGVNVADKKSDREHQYGHERMESVASIVLAVMLAITGIGIGIAGIEKIRHGIDSELAAPGLLALIAAVISILVKEWMYHFTKNAAEKINSGALMADAWHHRSDSMSSIGSFIGIFGARMGIPILDPIASVVICAFILKAAYDIFKDATDKMVDKSCDEDTTEAMTGVIVAVDGVEHIDKLMTRLFGSKIYVEVEITVDGSMSLLKAHNIAEKVHESIEHNFSSVKHCMVHVNPDSDDR